MMRAVRLAQSRRAAGMHARGSARGAARRAAVVLDRPARWFSAAPSAERAEGDAAGKVELHQGDNLRFDHVQFYLQSLRPLASYQQLENDLAAFGGVGGTSAEEVPALAERWRSVASSAKPAGAAYSPFGQDLVEQMLIGAGWRIAASHAGALTESVLIRCAAALPPARIRAADPRGRPLPAARPTRAVFASSPPPLATPHRSTPACRTPRCAS